MNTGEKNEKREPTPAKSENELKDAELDKVTGGKPCATGAHIKDAVITTR